MRFFRFMKYVPMRNIPDVTFLSPFRNAVLWPTTSTLVIIQNHCPLKVRRSSLVCAPTLYHTISHSHTSPDLVLSGQSVPSAKLATLQSQPQLIFFSQMAQTYDFQSSAKRAQEGCSGITSYAHLTKTSSTVRVQGDRWEVISQVLPTISQIDYVSGCEQEIEGRNLFPLISLSSRLFLHGEHLTGLSIITVVKIYIFYLLHGSQV